MQLHISLVILPIDDFTGRVIHGSGCRIMVEGAGRPIVKPEGFWVFTGVMGQEIRVELWGQVYRKMQIRILQDDLDPRNPVMLIRVKPNRNYPFPRGTAFMQGSLPAHSILLAAGKTKSCAHRLRLDGKEGEDTLAVYQKNEKILTQTSYLLSDRGGNTQEWVELLSPVDIEKGIYHMKTPICHHYEKAKADLFPAVRYEADVLGESYFIAVWGGTETDTIPVFCLLEQSGEGMPIHFC